MSFEEFFRKATGLDRPPYSYQQDLANKPFCDRIIRVPTGSGKTAAAVLSWLWKVHHQEAGTPMRLVFALPMRSLVEQTVQNIRKWLKNLGFTDEVCLIELMGGQEGLRSRQGQWIEEPDKRTILVGTVDLLLSAALNRGYAMPRTRWAAAFGLLHNSALWVVDEVQLMDRAATTFSQLSYFRKTFGTLQPVYTWWMSATVEPKWLQTVDFQTPPEATLPDVNRLHEELGSRFTAAKPLQKILKALTAETVRSVHQPKTLTMVVVNTVKTARALFTELEAKPAGTAKKKKQNAGSSGEDNPEIRLLHSRFRPLDRKEQAEHLINFKPDSERGLIVVATQVVEAGLDVSATTMITELAPWASMVQRFGRLNRDGKAENAQAYWMDVKSANAAPYEAAQLDEARERIAKISDVGISTLSAVALPDPEKPAYVIRQNDFWGLFYADKDLAGGFTDISEYIRDSEERTVYLFWRETRKGPNHDDKQPEAERHELCPVPIEEAKEFAKKHSLWEWSEDNDRWESRPHWELVPGMTLLCNRTSGGYSTRKGWTGEAGDVPELAQQEIQQKSNNAENGDPDSESTGWYPLSQHLKDAEEEARLLGKNLGLSPEVAEALCLAARWHDLGKSTPLWQAKARIAAQKSGYRLEQGCWAKFPANRNRFRPGFRHEEASALYAAECWKRGKPGWSALAVYLIACHHGKIRTALGVYGEKTKGIFELKQEERVIHLPGWVEEPTDFNPAWLGFAPQAEYDRNAGKLVVDGPNWTELIEELLGSENGGSEQEGALGPFRLAFLENLIMCADVRASRKIEAGINAVKVQKSEAIPA